MNIFEKYFLGIIGYSVPSPTQYTHRLASMKEAQSLVMNRPVQQSLSSTLPVSMDCPVSKDGSTEEYNLTVEFTT